MWLGTSPYVSHPFTVAGLTEYRGLYLEGGAKRGGFDPDHAFTVVGVQAAHRFVVHTCLSVQKQFKFTLKEKTKDEEMMLNWSTTILALSPPVKTVDEVCCKEQTHDLSWLDAEISIIRRDSGC